MTTDNFEIGLVRRSFAIFDQRKKRIWLLVLGLAVFVALVEAIGALLMFVLFQLLDDPDNLSMPEVLSDVGLSSQRLRDSTSAFLVFCAVFFLGRGLLLMFQRYVQSRFEQGVGRDTSVRIFETYMKMPYTVHLNRNSSELVRTAFWSVNQMVLNLVAPATALLSESFVVLAIILVLLVTSPTGVAVTLAVVGPVVGLVLWLLQPRLRRLGAQTEEAVEQSIRFLSQPLEGVRDVKVLQKEQFFKRNFFHARSRLAVARYWRATLQAVPRIVLETTVFLAVISVLALAVFGSRGSEAGSLAVLGLFGYAAVRLLPSVNRMSAAATRIRYGEAAVDNVYRDLIVQPSEWWSTHSADEEGIEPDPLTFSKSIEFLDITYRYEDGTIALENVSLRIEPGQFVGIVGPTGAGKTTLMDLAIGLLKPSDGEVRVDGRDIHSNLSSWWGKLGLVPQNVFLLDDTLRRNIALGVPDHEIDEESLDNAIDAAQLDSYVSSLPLGLESVVGERGVRISGGQRQRIAIARALYGQPEVLLFDEGTAALDTLTERALLTALERLRGAYTMISIAHRLASVEQCDWIVLLVEGRVIDVGGYEELRARNPVFDRMAG